MAVLTNRERYRGYRRDERIRRTVHSIIYAARTKTTYAPVESPDQYSFENVAADLEGIILDELDFDRDREIMIEIGEGFAYDDQVVVPDVHGQLSSERILAMEYLTGRRVTDDDAFDGVDIRPHEKATRVTGVYLEMGLIDENSHILTVVNVCGSDRIPSHDHIHNGPQPSV